ncbi:MAG: hypothetical protein R3316_00590 [Rhodovibrionaceae bacterium]|nr:hypothetical protein [Rhodovibrionaceae bacterium]
MTAREFFENALGVALVALFVLLVAGGVLFALGSVPLLVAFFPLSVTLLAIVILVAYLRHRRARRRRPDYENELD